MERSARHRALARPLTPAEARLLLLSSSTERAYESAVRSWLDLGGWLTHVVHDSRHSPSGFPDILAIHPRRRLLLAAELKSARGRTRREQPPWLDAFHGVSIDNPTIVVGLFRPVHSDELRDWLLGLTDRPPQGDPWHNHHPPAPRAIRARPRLEAERSPHS